MPLRDNNLLLDVAAGQTLQSIADIGLLSITTYDNREVYLKDVANITAHNQEAEAHVWYHTKNISMAPAISIAIAKRAGSNAIILSENIKQKIATLKNNLIPGDIEVIITRDYGETASEKSNRLLEDLLLATIAVVLLISIAIGLREGLVVLVVIPATILSTIFFTWILNYTINRVSLFALIFSIGILVDDAIVFTENIVRRWRLSNDKNLQEIINTTINAVIEVGSPTIMATLTIIAALMPMVFVSGLMGPYMKPIPINASIAMLLSLVIAFIIVPWLLLKIRGFTPYDYTNHIEKKSNSFNFLLDFYKKVTTQIVYNKDKARMLIIIAIIITIFTCGLFFTKSVTLKMLPFDNKSEIMLEIDMKDSVALEVTDRVAKLIAQDITNLPEVQSAELYIGTAAPFNFNGLVRHSYIRKKADLAEIKINLLPKNGRKRTSHEIALELRERVKKINLQEKWPHAVIEIIEVPPGPPVLSTLVAEVYGEDAVARRNAANNLKELFYQVPFITDQDDSFGRNYLRLRIVPNQEKLRFYKVEEKEIYTTIKSLLDNTIVGYSHKGGGTYPVAINIILPKEAKVLNEKLLSTPVPARNGVVELGSLIDIIKESTSHPIFRRNGYDIDMVTAELAGKFEAPIYGMLAVERLAKKLPELQHKVQFKYHGQPLDERNLTVLWDGEWEVTYVTFRDLGIAFIIAILAIYGLLVIEFKNFLLPIIVLTPVPLVLIGVILGHWVFNAPFTATSMIGLIALSGIVVRNSLLLVAFIEERKLTTTLPKALLDSGAIRSKPIILTALAAMLSALFMFTDPIFQGLAISLFFGICSSTILTLIIIPALYTVIPTLQ